MAAPLIRRTSAFTKAGGQNAHRNSAAHEVAKDAMWESVAAEQTILPTGISSAELFGDPVIQPGEVTVLPTGISSAELFGDPVIQPGEVTVSPASIASLETFGVAIASVTTTINAFSIVSSGAFGTPRLLRMPKLTRIIVA